MNDYYKILEIDKSASPEEIKQAYRKMAMKHHPDRGGDDEQFKRIQEAYDVLSDPEKKSLYDNPQPQFHGFSSGMPHDFEDIFSQMFGGNPFNSFFGHRPHSQRNRTLNIQTSITLEEAFTGKDMIANIKLPSGRDQMLEIKIPAGIDDGMVLRLSEMGDDSIPSAPRGDIHLTVNVQPHPVFSRQGDDLIVTAQINCIDAMLGKNIKLNTIDGKTLDIKVPPGTQHNQILSAPGYGMPKVSDNRFKGRMLISIEITIPTNLNDAQKDILKQLVI